MTGLQSECSSFCHQSRLWAEYKPLSFFGRDKPLSIGDSAWGFNRMQLVWELDVGAELNGQAWYSLQIFKAESI